MSYVIEKNVPMPAKRLNGGRNGKYPWHELEIGESFVIPKKEITLGQLHRGWRPQPPKNLRETGYRVSTRNLPEQGIRVWRVE
jgi:hypothetical protein